MHRRNFVVLGTLTKGSGSPLLLELLARHYRRQGAILIQDKW
jgi:NAD(P)H-dependent FMN reductase